MTYLVIASILFFVWILINCKTSRADGTLVPGVHPYRVMLGHITPSRNQAIVYFDSYVRADKLIEYVAQAKSRHDFDITHCLIAAVGAALAQNPRLNRFVVGRRLYQRNERSITFSAKRKRLDRDAKLATIKIALQDGESLGSLCGRINRGIGEERSGAATYMDRELGLLTSLPRAVLIRGVKLFQWLDHHNLLPPSFVDNDAMFCSVFIANLGSLDMDPGYHHLYEWGNCPIFLTAGRIADRPVVEGDRVVAQKTLHLRWSYDERIDDGLNARFGMEAVKRILEDPAAHLGPLDSAG